jgi:hypothetical protein
MRARTLVVVLVLVVAVVPQIAVPACQGVVRGAVQLVDGLLRGPGHA